MTVPTTVAQMIAWLQTLPQDAQVECGEEVTKGYSTYMQHRPVDIDFSPVCTHEDGRTVVYLETQ